MNNWPQVSIDTVKSPTMCFCCGKDNPIGLKLDFTWEDGVARAEFTPNELYQGWAGILHGGIISCLLDEGLTYATYFSGLDCITARMQVRLRQPISIGEPLVITASIAKQSRRLIETHATLSLKDGTPVAEGTATMFVIGPRENSEKRLDGDAKSKAVIWDMDGVIAATAPYHLKSWQEVFQKRGIEFTEQQFSHHFGQRNDTIIRSAAGEDISRQEMEAIADQKEKSFRRHIGQNIKPLPGVIELMNALLQHGFEMALASSAPVENIELITRSLGIDRLFHRIISGHEVPRGKPSPDVFLLAAERLGVKPARCIVIEDAVAGVAAAKKAGMFCLGVTNTHPGASLSEADLIVDSLATIGVNDLENILHRGVRSGKNTGAYQA